MEQMQSSEIRYRRLFEAARDGILILDAETGEIKDVNPFLMELLGYSYAKFLGKNLWDLGAFKDVAASKAAFVELKQKKYVRYNDLPLKSKKGRLIAVELSIRLARRKLFSATSATLRNGNRLKRPC